MTIPPWLKVGDKVAIVSTARRIKSTEIQASLDILKLWGFVPVVGKTIGRKYHQFAGSDLQRVNDFQELLDDDSIKAIWCARGGYGTVRIIDDLHFSKFRKQPKWIIGYSDVTVLHSHIHRLGIATIHAPMPIDFYNCTNEATEIFKKVLMGESVDYIISSTKKNRRGIGTGALVGGNLSILYSLCGSDSSIDTTGKILCIEDLDEYLYHIDRMLQNLKRNRYFEGLQGLIVGAMTKMHDNTVPFGKNAKEIILDTVREYDFPVVFNFPMGHIKDNRALILGATISLEAGEKEVRLRYV